jgi:hypothetical protein
MLIFAVPLNKGRVSRKQVVQQQQAADDDNNR